MSNLVVIGFDGEQKAEEVRLAMVKMQQDYLIDLEDAVVAVKNQEGKVLKTSLSNDDEAKLQAAFDSAKQSTAS